MLNTAMSVKNTRKISEKLEEEKHSMRSFIIARDTDFYMSKLGYIGRFLAQD